LTYKELDVLVGRLARLLLDQGAQPADRVATWLPKTIEACLLPLAAARAGLIHVPINPALRPQQLAHILEDSGATLLVTAKARAALLAPTSARILIDQEIFGDWQSGESLAASQARPKGVMLSHGNLWLGAASVAHYLDVLPKDRTLCVLPLSFDYGQNQLFNSWYGGAVAMPLDYLTPRDVVRAVGRHDVTTLAGVPPLWVQLIEVDWPSDVAGTIRKITNSGGALTPGLIAALKKTFPAAKIYPMYGLTEAFRSTYLDPALVDTHPTSIGTAIPFAEIMIVRPDGSLAESGEVGELVHAGPLVAQGYWKDKEKTEKRFKVAPPASTYGGTAVWSGDKAKQDVDGLLYFVGRDDEMIKVAGNRISPTEIEEAAEASGSVAESVAIGVPDDRLGQAIILVARAKANADHATLSDWFKREMPAFMTPKEIIWRDELPRNPNGKLDRAALRAEYGQ
jgi:acyl-CoA synthetase (AMP-forming)/AMP-acid ligase II